MSSQDYEVGSPDGTFITAQQGDEVRLIGVPTRLFEPAPLGYLHRDPDASTGVNAADVEEDLNKEGDTDSCIDASECNELDQAMQDAFWDRVQILVKNDKDDVEQNVSDADMVMISGNSKINFPKPPPRL